MPSFDGDGRGTVCLARYRAEHDERRAPAAPESDRPAALASPFSRSIESKALSPAGLAHRRRMLAHLSRSSGTGHAPR